MIPTTRRQFLRLAILGSGGALLAACAQPAQQAPTRAPAVATPQVVPTQPPPAAKPAPTLAAEAAKPTAAPAAAGQVRDVNFVVVDGTEPNSLDPPVGTGPFQHILNAIYDRLVVWSDKMEAEPGLATSWEVSPDGKTWTFKLRQGVKFHDGTPFNSQAVKVTIEHLLDKDTASTRRASYTLIKEILTPDDATVRFVTDPPTPDLPFLMADGSVKIISPAALQKYGRDFGRNPVGTGPFKFEEWVPNDHVSAIVNPDYWGPKSLVRRFVYRPIPEAAGRVVALKTGEADVVLNLPPADVDNLKQDPNVAVQVTPGLTIVEAEPRQSKPPLSDVRVRYALNHAIDKDAIINKIMRGLALPLNTPSIPGLWGTFDFEPIKYDVERARRLIGEAGYTAGMDIALAYVSGRWAGDDQVVEAMQGYWNNIGVRATIKKIQSAELGPLLQTDPDTLSGTLVFLLKTSEYVDYHLYRMYHTEATLRTVTAQRYAYTNPEVDKLIEQEQKTFEPDKRLPVLKQAQELIWKDQPLVYLFHQVNIWGQRKNVSGFKFIATNQIMPGQVQKST
ncbi:MAG TPA: ABC transporter substrate-binding protein [Chloroflexota bacterium]|nr:ABC transporter substrate-binding protein [Chloroflexota bacterium]